VQRYRAACDIPEKISSASLTVTDGKEVLFLASPQKSLVGPDLLQVVVGGNELWKQILANNFNYCLQKH